MRKPPASVAQILGNKGPLAQLLPDYQLRTEQQIISEAIDDSMAHGHHALIEAGTGVGKSLAYLIPAARAIANGKKVVISTHTINLQSQLMNKDIPLLMKLFPKVDIRPVLMKGRSNYLCVQDLQAAGQDLLQAGDPIFFKLKEWAQNTDSGDIADLPFTYNLWYEVAANADTCRGKECPHYNTCFYYDMRRMANASNLFVVNHALFLSDLMVRSDERQGAVLPEYDIVVFDEAHHLEDVATSSFGIEFGNRRIPQLLDKIKRTRGLDIDVNRIEAISVLNENLFGAYESNEQEFFLHEAAPGAKSQEANETASRLCVSLGVVATELAEAAKDAEDGSPKDRLQGLTRMASRMKEELDTLAFGKDPTFIRWGSRVTPPQGRASRYGIRTTLYYTPIEVGPILDKLLWSSVSTAILCSATLANSGGFDYLRKRLQLPDSTTEQIVGSPFDFRNHALLYVPANLPEPPKSYTGQFLDEMADEIERIINITRGRAFLLFTSRFALSAIFDRLKDRVEYPLFRQGDLAPAILLKKFKESGNGCLFGNQTFWEGVDVPGDALSCVVIDRLPFAVPNSPINRARTEQIVNRGGDWFQELSIPQAQIRLKQGFGRLIRNSTDRGMVCILDTRILTRNYGADFVKYLPPASRASKWSRVERFWNSAED